MRSLATFGMIAAFIAMAFVPPSEASGPVPRISTLSVPGVTQPLSEAAIAFPLAVAHSLDWKVLLQTERNITLKKAYESIDWAQRKASVALCKQFDASSDDFASKGMPTRGDLLALCLAKVTADPARCDQIDGLSAPVLRAICETELVART